MKKYYIAYGSNLNIFQMGFRCPGAKVAGKAKLEDWALVYRKSGSGAFFSIEPRKGSYVPVGIWEVSEQNEMSLDRYEGYPDHYYKTEMKVKLEDTDKTVNAFVYIMPEDSEKGTPDDIPDIYVDICEEGYWDFDFDTEVLEKAYQEAIEEEEKWK